MLLCVICSRHCYVLWASACHVSVCVIPEETTALCTHLVNFDVICVYHDHIFTVWQDFDLSHSRIAKIQNLEQLSQVQVSCH